MLVLALVVCVLAVIPFCPLTQDGVAPLINTRQHSPAAHGKRKASSELYALPVNGGGIWVQG